MSSVVRPQCLCRRNVTQNWTIKAFLAFVTFITFPKNAAEATDVWLSTVDPVTAAHFGFGSDGYKELWAPNANWPAGAAGIQAFETSTQFINLASDEQLKTVLADLARRHIKLAVSGLMLTGTDRCGHQVEGYSGPRAIERAAQRVKQFGSAIDFLVMDEPLLYGHMYHGPGACRDALREVAKQVSEKIHQAKAVFPSIEVGDVEVISAPAEADLLAQLKEWLAAYQAEVGERLAFMQTDLNWTNPHWPSDLRSVANLLHSASVPLGIIYNGSREDKSDIQWTNHAVERFKYIEANLRIVPDYAIIATWTQRPSRLLPESEPGTLTSVLKQYLDWHAQARGR
jgi:hypothetical protein